MSEPGTRRLGRRSPEAATNPDAQGLLRPSPGRAAGPRPHPPPSSQPLRKGPTPRAAARPPEAPGGRSCLRRSSLVCGRVGACPPWHSQELLVAGVHAPQALRAPSRTSCRGSQGRDDTAGCAAGLPAGPRDSPSPARPRYVARGGGGGAAPVGSGAPSQGRAWTPALTSPGAVRGARGPPGPGGYILGSGCRPEEKGGLRSRAELWTSPTHCSIPLRKPREVTSGCLRDKGRGHRGVWVTQLRYRPSGPGPCDSRSPRA